MVEQGNIAILVGIDDRPRLFSAVMGENACNCSQALSGESEACCDVNCDWMRRHC